VAVGGVQKLSLRQRQQNDPGLVLRGQQGRLELLSTVVTVMAGLCIVVMNKKSLFFITNGRRVCLCLDRVAVLAVYWEWLRGREVARWLTGIVVRVKQGAEQKLLLCSSNPYPLPI